MPKFSIMPSADVVRARIAELEDEEKRLFFEDRRFWDRPEHTPEAQDAYTRRREQIRRIRQELQELQKDLGTGKVREASR